MNYNKTKLQSFAFKPKHVYPKLEDIQQDTQYALSINPEIQKDSLIEMDNIHDNIFHLLKKYSTYKVQPELSTKSILLHYHGWIQFKTQLEIVNFYFYVLPRLKDICTLTIIPITDPIEWYLYVNKQKHLMYYLYQKNNIPYKKKHINDHKI